MSKRVLVLGCGNFGTCLAEHLAALGNPVTIWTRSQAVADSINTRHINPEYLSQFTLSDNLKAVCEISSSVVDSADIILFAIPTQYSRSVLEQLKPLLKPKHMLIFVNKGIELATGLLPNAVVSDVLGPEYGNKAAFLSGPSFAVEIMDRQPTCVAVASKTRESALRTQALFHAPFFRVYDMPDTVALEIAGALKNVIAVAAGACAGAGFQMNARAAIITRGLAEITRFGVALGANPLSFSGLSGVGDLFLTCTSEKSRNYTVGYRIGKGEKLDDIVKSLGSVAEGVPTTKAAYDLARKLGVEAPITQAVYSVLYEGKSLADALRDLTDREAHSEFRGIH